ncbi:hypothetical protein DMH04_27905 [Kibdelosporangium aridum]|uniref:Uncharacterized protein n=1 Tax=Kibdelosporangium aridum TaxID=2030 RepID=A0A428Z479_KIBAR|nr:hypothetical protein [Kibdelosporangium aridum]RSM81227.1 hypothetical protein DMH04_27905 [Kibdelosporangium aridum]
MLWCSPLTPPHPVFVRYEPDITGKTRTCRIVDQQGSKALELNLKQATTEEDGSDHAVCRSPGLRCPATRWLISGNRWGTAVVHVRAAVVDHEPG